MSFKANYIVFPEFSCRNGYFSLKVKSFNFVVTETRTQLTVTLTYHVGHSGESLKKVIVVITC